MSVSNTLKCHGLHTNLGILSESLTVNSATDSGHEQSLAFLFSFGRCTY